MKPYCAICRSGVVVVVCIPCDAVGAIYNVVQAVCFSGRHKFHLILRLRIRNNVVIYEIRAAYGGYFCVNKGPRYRFKRILPPCNRSRTISRTVDVLYSDGDAAEDKMLVVAET